MPKPFISRSRRDGTQEHSPPTPLIAFVLGTRPEAIKLAPVILCARRRKHRLHPVIISTGQQADLLAPALESFGIKADVDLSVMRRGQSLDQLAARCLTRVSDALRSLRPRIVVVQGDTTSALAGAQAAFYERIAVAHVEAGLRTGDLAAPFPEEANRQMISRLATLHFAPTLDGKANLLAEGIDPAAIEVTGNTVVDALELLRGHIVRTPLPADLLQAWSPNQKLVLVTAHRRENLGAPLHSICSAIENLAAARPELHFAFITHPNPAASQTAQQRLRGCRGITLSSPLPYLQTLRLVSSAWLVLTDSGGLQEEAPSFGCPVLVLRDRTERTEGISAGVARLIGTDSNRIYDAIRGLLDSPNQYAQSTRADNPYGDGRAAERIVESIRRHVAQSSLKSVA